MSREGTKIQKEGFSNMLISKNFFFLLENEEKDLENIGMYLHPILSIKYIKYLCLIVIKNFNYGKYNDLRVIIIFFFVMYILLFTS